MKSNAWTRLVPVGLRFAPMAAALFLSAGIAAGQHPILNYVNPNPPSLPPYSPPPPSNAAGSGATVLILADVSAASTTALAATLTAAGNTVTLRPPPDYTWVATNPPLTGFNCVVHLKGFTPFVGLPVSAQTALESFVSAGGGFITSQWDGFDLTTGLETAMPDLILQRWADGATDNCGGCSMTYTTVPAYASHPVLAGIPSPFVFYADGHDAGSQVVFGVTPSTVLMRAPSGGPAVLARSFGSGRVVEFSHAANYGGTFLTLLDPNIEKLYVNAVAWACNGAVAGCPDHTVHGHITTTPPDRHDGDSHAHHAQHGHHLLPGTVCLPPGHHVTVNGHILGLTPESADAVIPSALTPTVELDFAGALNQDGTTGPAARGAIVQLFGSARGLFLDLADLRPALGFTPPASGSPLYHTESLPEVQIGGAKAEVLFSGLAPGLNGVWQINVRIPGGIATGKVPVTISYEGEALTSIDLAVE